MSDASTSPPLRASDLELVRAVLRGDPEALERFLHRMQCVPRILHARNRQLPRPLDARELEDLAQDTLTAVWRRLSTFDGRAALETWVYRFCVLELLHRLRREERFPALLDESAEPLVVDSTEDVVDAMLDYERVLRSLERLDPDEADVIRLKQLEDRTFPELSRTLGISANTAKTRYYRGLRKLRRLLAPPTTEGIHSE